MLELHILFVHKYSLILHFPFLPLFKPVKNVWQKWCVFCQRERRSHVGSQPDSLWFFAASSRVAANRNRLKILRDKTQPQGDYPVSTPHPFISLHQITWLLAKWTASAFQGKSTVCIFPWTKWDVVDLFFQEPTRWIGLGSFECTSCLRS